MDAVKRIVEREALRALAAELGVRPDWHEPDEQDLTAEVRGRVFDNAGFWPKFSQVPAITEMHVLLKRGGKPIAAVNLATLFAWACTEPVQLPARRE